MKMTDTRYKRTYKCRVVVAGYAHKDVGRGVRVDGAHGTLAVAVTMAVAVVVGAVLATRRVNLTLNLRVAPVISTAFQGTQGVVALTGVEYTAAIDGVGIVKSGADAGRAEAHNSCAVETKTLARAGRAEGADGGDADADRGGRGGSGRRGGGADRANGAVAGS